MWNLPITFVSKQKEGQHCPPCCLSKIQHLFNNKWKRRERRNMTYNDVKWWSFNRNFNALYLQSRNLHSQQHLKSFQKLQTLDSGFSSVFAWGTALWSFAFWRLFELKINISHIMINDWLDFHVMKKCENTSICCSDIRCQTSCCVSYCVQ